MITVTIEIDWNVTAVRKSIPASYTTQVSNGTVLVDILNKAAGENKQGPYNRYSTTYYAGLGHMIIAMNGTWQEPETVTLGWFMTRELENSHHLEWILTSLTISPLPYLTSLQFRATQAKMQVTAKVTGLVALLEAMRSAKSIFDIP